MGETTPVEPPYELEWHWGVFCELSRARPISGSGSCPIDFRQIQAWSGLMGVKLTPWEIRLIRAVDDIWIEEERDRSSATGTKDQE